MPSRPTRRSLRLAGALGLAALAVGVGPAAAATGDVDPASIRQDGTLSDRGAAPGAVSADGRYVAFASESTNLSADDRDPFNDIFLKDMETGAVTLVSRRSASDGGAPADAASYAPAISADGRYVAFESDADNLSTEDDDDVTDVFVRDTATDTTVLASRLSAADGGAAADGDSSDPAISADGRHVAFESQALNLVVGDTVGADVFVRDLQTETTTWLSRQSDADGGDGGQGISYDPSISADGRLVVFVSEADNLSQEDDDRYANIFARDEAARTTTLVSRQSAADGGAGGDGNSSDPTVSADGTRVAFSSTAGNLSAEDASFRDVFVRDLAVQTTALVSRRSDALGGEAADEGAFEPRISADGLHVVFSSDSENLSDVDEEDQTDAFARDLVAGTTTLVSRQPPGAGGAGADGTSYADSVSGDGRYVAITSLAANLAPVADPPRGDVFRVDLRDDPPPPPPAPPAETSTTTEAGATASGAPATTTAADLCAPAPSAATPSSDKDEVELSVGQLRINQRISQAAIRRLNAVQAWLDAGIEGRDVCGGALGQAEFLAGAAHEVAAAPLAPLPVADPRPVTPQPATEKTGVEFTLSAAQLLINQRIDQAAVRRANALEARLASGLTGGDVADGALTQGRLHDRLHVLAVPGGSVPASTTTVAPRATPADPDSVRVSAGQLAINQRIAQAGVRRSNALIVRLETGLTAADFRDGTIGAADLAPGVVG